MWLASKTMGKGRPSSDWKESIGDRVPLLRMTERQHSKSANPWQQYHSVHIVVVEVVVVIVFHKRVAY